MVVQQVGTKFVCFTHDIVFGLTSTEFANFKFSATTVNGGTTDTGNAHLRDGQPHMVMPIIVYPLLNTGIVSTTTSYSVTSLDDVIFADATNGDLIVTLPIPNSARRLIIKKVDLTAKTVTISTSSGLLDGFPSVDISIPFTTLEIASDGTNWFII